MITAMITPALLILASGSLIATVLVRLARVVDRVRKLAELRDALRDADEIRRHERRALLAERAISLYFFAVLCFVIAGFVIAIDHAVGDRLTWLPVAVTPLGLGPIAPARGALLSYRRPA